MITDHCLPEEIQPDGAAGISRPELASAWASVAGASPLAAISGPDPGRVLAIGQMLTAHALPSRRMRLVTIRRLSIAAGIALLVATGAILWSQPVHTVADAALDVALPDGSTASLEPGSELAYHRSLGRFTRHVALQGAAFFDVQPGESPFVIQTADLRVTVLGTRFSVDVTGDEAVVYVTEGSVEVAAHGQVRRLTADQGLRADRQSGTLTAVVQNKDATPDLFVQIKQPLGVMFDEVEQIFEVEVIADDRIRRHVHNFKHEISTVDALISDLCRSVTSMNLRYRLTATGFEILDQ